MGILVNNAGKGLINNSGKLLIKPFMPNDIQNILFWFDASYGVTKDGSNKVARIDCKAGSNNYLYQGTQTDKPTFISNSINGLPTIFLNKGSAGSYCLQLGIGTNYVGYYTFYILHSCPVNGYGGSKVYILPYNLIYINVDTIFGSKTYPNKYDWHLITVKYGASNHKYFLDSIELLNSAGGTGTITMGGAITQGNAAYSTSCWAEMVCYKEEHSDLQRRQVETYFRQKYALTI